MLFQSQQKSFIVANKDNLLPIQDVQAESKGYQTFSDKNGRIIFFYDRATEITLSHINYTTLTIPISQIKDTVFMTLSRFESDVTITADRLKLVQAGVSETKREIVLLPQNIINTIPEINTSIKSLSQVALTEDINGENFINVLGSNDNEIRYFINNMSMFSYAKQKNYSGLVLTQLLKDVNLDIGSRDNYLASINLSIDQFIRPEFAISVGNSEKSIRRNFIFKDDNIVSISGFNYTNQYNENSIKDEFEHYDYNFSTDKYNFNDFLILKYDDWQINNTLLLEYRTNEYLDGIVSKERSVINGIDINYKSWHGNIEVLATGLDYKNKSDYELLDTRETASIQSKFNLAKTIGDSIRGLYVEYEFLYLNEDFKTEFGTDITNNVESDAQHTVILNQKFIPDIENTNELKTVLELGLSISQHKKDVFVKSGSIKSALVFDLKPTIIDFYADLNFGKVPFYDVNQIYLSSKSDTLTPYLENTNMTFGIKASFKKVTADLSYSQREYKSCISKLYSTIFNEYLIYTDNKVNTVNLKLDFNISMNLKANSSIMLTSADDFKQFSNKPEFLQTHNFIYTYKNYDLQLNIKVEKDKYLTYELNGILYQRPIKDSRDVSLFISGSNILSTNLSASFAITNLLKDNIYTLNGFFNNRQKFVGTISYAF